MEKYLQAGADAIRDLLGGGGVGLVAKLLGGEADTLVKGILLGGTGLCGLVLLRLLR